MVSRKSLEIIGFKKLFIAAFALLLINNVEAAKKQVVGFVPKLIKVEANYDYLQLRETLGLTLSWQNAGDALSAKPLAGSLELAIVMS